jgi:hypothetical protein
LQKALLEGSRSQTENDRPLGEVDFSLAFLQPGIFEERTLKKRVPLELLTKSGAKGEKKKTPVIGECKFVFFNLQWILFPRTGKNKTRKKNPSPHKRRRVKDAEMSYDKRYSRGTKMY